MKPGTRTLLAGGAVFAAMSIISVQTPAQQRLAAQQAPSGPEVVREEVVSGPAAAGGAAAGAGGGGAGAAAGAGARKAGAAAGAAPSRFQCAAGQNGGATDKGVSATKIRLASTHVLSGDGSSFLGSSHVGMEAVVSNINSKGGICGRLLDLTLRDDGWQAPLGASFIQNFINDPTGYFALPVVPSSEGLTQAIKSRYIGNGKVPVVGTDGMLKEQYQDPYVWPVATATVSTMRIMAKQAYDSGARQFGIVWDSRYKFGKEGAKAFEQYVKKLPGAHLDANIGIPPGQPSYPDTERFNADCGPAKRCEFVAMLLEPGTAISWINSMGDDSAGRRLGFGSKGTGGAQPLFNAKFARDCGEPCNGMLLWTGYNPPIGEKLNLPGVAKYVNDVKAIDPGADVSNQFLEGAYLGMTVFVEALKRVGPELTRARLKEVMDSLAFQSDLASPLTYGPSRHYANLGAQAFTVRTAAGSFSGFADAGTGFILDPSPGDFPSGG
ncbi:MAG TPA: ABC transporter substrate-binding protein [Acidimicrobiales bacterium]|jgi:ABC-type branched-subunit amino acid transport system substrate-binding protein|nr:ABC transporter substrate-binding protein [Acidimicrobiales bacterium]